MTDKTNGHDGLHPKVTELARRDNFAALTTLMPDGHSQTHVMWMMCAPWIDIRCE